VPAPRPVTTVAEYCDALSLVRGLLTARIDQSAEIERVAAVTCSIVDAVELQCFDFAICDYLLDPRGGIDDGVFFEDCFRPRHRVFPFSFGDLGTVAAHMRHLRGMLSHFMGRTGRKQGGAPARFDSVNTGMNRLLESMIAEAATRTGEPRDLPDAAVYADVDLGAYLAADARLAAGAFAAFVRDKVLGEGARSARVVGLVDRVALALTAVQQLQERITVTRDVAMADAPAGLAAAADSPRARVVLDGCCFLKRLLAGDTRSPASAADALAAIDGEVDQYQEYCASLHEATADELRRLDAEIAAAEERKRGSWALVRGTFARASEVFGPARTENDGTDAVHERIDALGGGSPPTARSGASRSCSMRGTRRTSTGSPSSITASTMTR